MTEIIIEQMKKAFECFEDISTNYEAGDNLEFELTAEGIDCFKIGAAVLRNQIEKRCPRCESEYFNGLCNCKYDKITTLKSMKKDT